MKFRIGNNRKNKTVDFGSIESDIIKELGIEESFTIEHMRSLWKDLVGEIIATHSIPDRIFKRTLFVSVDHSTYANELIMMKDIILQRLHEKMHNTTIKNVKVEIKKVIW